MSASVQLSLLLHLVCSFTSLWSECLCHVVCGILVGARKICLSQSSFEAAVVPWCQPMGSCYSRAICDDYWTCSSSRGLGSECKQPSLAQKRSKLFSFMTHQLLQLWGEPVSWWTIHGRRMWPSHILERTFTHVLGPIQASCLVRTWQSWLHRHQ